MLLTMIWLTCIITYGVNQKPPTAVEVKKVVTPVESKEPTYPYEVNGKVEQLTEQEIVTAELIKARGQSHPY